MNDHQLMNLIGNPYGVYIDFEIDKPYNMIDLLEKSYLSYDMYFINEKTRKAIMKTPDDFIIQ